MCVTLSTFEGTYYYYLAIRRMRRGTESEELLHFNESLFERQHGVNVSIASPEGTRLNERPVQLP